MPTNNTGIVVGYLAGKYPRRIGHLFSPEGSRETHDWLPFALDNGKFAGTVTRDWLDELRSTTSFWCYYLCPLWGRDMNLTAELAWRAKWDLTCQMHKYGGLQ